MPLTAFPGALFDDEGYVVFASRADYVSCSELRHGPRLNVRAPGISAIRGYVRVP